MTRLLVLAEGDSEELFVKRMLAPHLASHSVYATPTLVETRRLADGRKLGGGNRWPRVRDSLKPLLADSDAWVTTLLDFYGLPDDFPGAIPARTARTPDAGVALLEQQLAAAIEHPPRFIPFFALHEFEAWYFSAPEKVGEHFDHAELESRLAQVVRTCGGPEQINHGADTHPSARLHTLGVGFRKTREISLLEKIGIPTIRNACPHFAQWLSRLEALGTPSSR
ncbi:MAG: DUF4276 family protein [Gammaproteobacteria bacterium]|nr:DUF4276 family protein [Gammaproteobacteria bacterium]